MIITPKTDQEIFESGLWPLNSVCSFEILSEIKLGNNIITTMDTVAKKSGNEMIQLVVRIYNSAGQDKIVIDYLLESSAIKLRNAAYACDLQDAYNSGQIFAKDFIGKRGDLKIGISKDITGQYPPKNNIVNYIVKSSRAENLGINDDIPF